MIWDAPNAAEWEALKLSIQVALGAVAVTALPGIYLGWLLARRRFFGKGVVDLLVHLPLVLPPVVVGYMLLLLLGRSGPISPILDAMGLDIAFTRRGAVMASAVMGFPLLVRAVRVSMESSDEGLEEAAALLGAGPLRRWWSITLPLAAPGIITGLMLAFARSLGEFGATIILAGNIQGETRTLPLAIFSTAQTPGAEGAALRLAVLSLVLSFASLATSEWLARRARRWNEP